MSYFVLSQLLIAIAIIFDIISFQFKQRHKIVFCLSISGVLISTHFFLLEQNTAGFLMVIATARYIISIFTTSKRVMYLLLLTSFTATSFTYAGITSILSFGASIFQTQAVFCEKDKRLRELMIIGTILWLIHNYLVGSPTAVFMEFLFIISNLVGYYKFYLKSQSCKE